MDSMDMSLSELPELVIYREAWRAAVHRVAKSRTRLSDFTSLHFVLKVYFLVYHFNSLGASCIISVIVAIFLVGHYN